MLLLILTNLTAYAHTLREQIHERIVKFVNLLTEKLDTLGCRNLITNGKDREDIVENIWCYLLLCIAPCLVWITMALNHKTIKAEVHSLLTQRSYEFTLTTHV